MQKNLNAQISGKYLFTTALIEVEIGLKIVEKRAVIAAGSKVGEVAVVLSEAVPGLGGHAAGWTVEGQVGDVLGLDMPEDVLMPHNFH